MLPTGNQQVQVCVPLGKVRKTLTTAPRDLCGQPHMHGAQCAQLAGAADPRSSCPQRPLGSVVAPSPEECKPHTGEGKGRHWIWPVGQSLDLEISTITSHYLCSKFWHQSKWWSGSLTYFHRCILSEPKEKEIVS